MIQTTSSYLFCTHYICDLWLVTCTHNCWYELAKIFLFHNSHSECQERSLLLFDSAKVNRLIESQALILLYIHSIQCSTSRFPTIAVLHTSHKLITFPVLYAINILLTQTISVHILFSFFKYRNEEFSNHHFLHCSSCRVLFPADFKPKLWLWTRFMLQPVGLLWHQRRLLWQRLLVRALHRCIRWW